MASEVPPLTEEGRALEDENLGLGTRMVTQQVVLLSRTTGEQTGRLPLPLGPPWLSQMGLDRGPPPRGTGEGAIWMEQPYHCQTKWKK